MMWLPGFPKANVLFRQVRGGVLQALQYHPSNRRSPERVGLVWKVLEFHDCRDLQHHELLKLFCTT